MKVYVLYKHHGDSVVGVYSTLEKSIEAYKKDMVYYDNPINTRVKQPVAIPEPI